MRRGREGDAGTQSFKVQNQSFKASRMAAKHEAYDKEGKGLHEAYKNTRV